MTAQTTTAREEPTADGLAGRLLARNRDEDGNFMRMEKKNFKYYHSTEREIGGPRRARVGACSAKVHRTRRGFSDCESPRLQNDRLADRNFSYSATRYEKYYIYIIK